MDHHRHHHHHDRREEDEYPPPARPPQPPFFAGNDPPPFFSPPPPPHAYHTSHMGPGPDSYHPPPPPNASIYPHTSHMGPGPDSYHPPPPPNVATYPHPPPPAVDHHPHKPNFPPVIHHNTHQVSDELSNRPAVRMYCKAETNYSLAIRDGKVILAPSNPSDLSQHWIKDEKLSTRVKDEEGFPSFALINKATGHAMKHSVGATHPVQLTHYESKGLDESILWTQSRDLGDGYRAIRMVNNIRLNVDAFNGDANHGGVHDGTKIVLWEWKKGDNQRWKIVPYLTRRLWGKTKRIKQNLITFYFPLNATKTHFPSISHHIGSRLHEFTGIDAQKYNRLGAGQTRDCLKILVPLSPPSMFGGLESIPNNSPHLRKSGSRSIVFDTGELGNSSEEDYLLSKESNEMKGGGVAPLSTSAIMPSPLLLWRFKVLLFFIWGLCCCKIGWDSVMRMSVDLRDLFLYEAFLYYNPLLLVTMMVWLWGINLWVFTQSNVGYAKIFDLDQSHLSHREIWKCATWMTIVVPTSMTAYLYLYSHGEVLLYAAVAMTLIFPFDIFHLSSRYFLLRTIWRIVFPLQAITFADFFLADIFTSMSKVFSDLERSVCRMVHRQVASIAWFEADSVCGSHSVAIPIVLVLPYIFRFFQCLRQYKDTREKTALLNALKYSTAVPVISLSALKYHVFPDKWTNIYRPLWLLSSVVNSLYSFYWDIKRDWDLSCFTRIFKFNKPHIISYLLYGRRWVYLWVIGSNLILRCTWTYKLSAHLRHNYITVFTITALEMLRRFQWVFFRVENEWNKTNSKSNSQISMTDMPREEDRLLGANGHNV